MKETPSPLKGENEDMEDNELSEILKSDEFKENFRKQVEADTWGKGLPMVYLDDKRRIVEHWKDGTINVLKESIDDGKDEQEIV